MIDKPAPGVAGPANGTQILAIYLIVCLTALALGLALFVLDPIKYKLISAGGGMESLRVVAFEALRVLSDRAIPLSVGMLGLALALLVLELRYATASKALLHVGTGHFGLLACALLLWFSQAYLYPGHLLAGDSGSHIVRTAHFGRGLKEGKFLFWDNGFYMGAPFLQFYAPLFFWLSGALFAALDSVDWAVKLLLLGCSLGGGLLFFAFLRQAGLQRVAALVGALGYTGAWAHGHLILYKGTLPLALILMLMPAAFLLAERLLAGGRLFGADWLGLALASAGLIATHQAHALFAGLYLGAYILVRSAGSEHRLRSSAVIASAGLAGVLITLFTVLPFLAEKSWVMASMDSSFFNFRLPEMSELRRLLVWRNTETSRGPESAAYLGMSIVLLGCAAVFRLARGGWRTGKPAWGVLVVGLALLSLVWHGLLVRDVIFTLFFFSALAGAGVHLLAERFPAAHRLPLCLLIAVLLDLGPTAVQPLARTDKAYLDAAGQYLALAKPPQRVVFTHTRPSPGQSPSLTVNVGPGGGPPEYFALQTVSGPHNHAATPVHNYAMAMLMRAQKDLRTRDALSEQSEAMLAMLNVGRIVNDTGRGIGLPQSVQGTLEEPPLGRVLKIAGTPAIFSSQLVTIAPPDGVERPLLWRESFDDSTDRADRTLRFVEKVFDSMAYRPATSLAERIPVRQPPSDTVTAPSVPGTPGIAVTRYSVEDDEVTMIVSSSHSGFLQLSHPWYPTLEVSRNGARIEPLRGTFNLIVVPVAGGENSYRIVPRRSALRTILGWLGVGTLLFSVVVPLLAAQSRRSRAAKERSS